MFGSWSPVSMNQRSWPDTAGAQMSPRSESICAAPASAHGVRVSWQWSGVGLVARKTHGRALQTCWVAGKGSWGPKTCYGEQGGSCVLCFSSAGGRLSPSPGARAAASLQAAPSSSCKTVAVLASLSGGEADETTFSGAGQALK